MAKKRFYWTTAFPLDTFFGLENSRILYTPGLGQRPYTTMHYLWSRQPLARRMLLISKPGRLCTHSRPVPSGGGSHAAAEGHSLFYSMLSGAATGRAVTPQAHSIWERQKWGPLRILKRWSRKTRRKEQTISCKPIIFSHLLSSHQLSLLFLFTLWLDCEFGQCWSSGSERTFLAYKEMVIPSICFASYRVKSKTFSLKQLLLCVNIVKLQQHDCMHHRIMLWTQTRRRYVFQHFWVFHNWCCAKRMIISAIVNDRKWQALLSPDTTR